MTEGLLHHQASCNPVFLCGRQEDIFRPTEIFENLGCIDPALNRYSEFTIASNVRLTGKTIIPGNFIG
jgi:hypothetical protein